MDSLKRLHVEDFSARRATMPPGFVTNNSVAPGAAIDADKLEGEYRHTLSQTGAVVAQTVYPLIVRGGEATVVEVQAALTEALATDVSRTVTVDLLRSTGHGAFASILNAPLVFTSSSTLRAVVEAVIAAPDLIDGDILKLTVAVAGGSGSQAEGLVVSVTWHEDAA